MLAAKNVGSGNTTLYQIFYGLIDMTIHDKYNPNEVRTTTDIVEELQNKIILKEVLQIPEIYANGLFRCRVTYSEKIEKIEFIPHQIKKINSLKLIEDNDIDYQFKFSDRGKLSQLFEKRGNCDDILIVKNGLISDSSTANPIFFDGDKWWCSDSPLLAGTQRSRLINEGKIKVCKITKNDISRYEVVGLINAMQDFDEMPVINTSNIIP